MSYPELNTPVSDDPTADDVGVARPPNQSFSALVEDAPFGVYVVDSRLRIWAVNRAVRAAIGEDTARPGRDFAEVLRIVWPEPGASRAIAQFRHTLETGEPYVAPRLTATRNDTHRIESYDWQIRRVTLPDGTFGVACYFLDLNVSYQAEAALAAAAERDAFLIALNDRLRPLRDPLEIQDEAVRVLGERLGTDWVHYTEFEGDFSYSTVHTNDVRSGAPSVVARHPMGNFRPLIDELRAGRTVAVEDLQMTPLVASEGRTQYAQFGLRAFVGAPIVKDGQLIAAFGVATRVPRVWTPQEIAFIEETAERTWAAVERARAEQAVANELRDTRLLHDLSARLVSEAHTQAFFDAILAAAVAITGASAGSMRMHDPATNDLTLLATLGFDAGMISRLPRVGASSINSAGRAFATGVRAFINFDDPFAADPDGSLRLHFEAGFRSAQSTPLVTRSGRTIGVLSTHWREHRRPSERELRFLDLLARQAADLIERRRADEALRESEQRLGDELADTKLLQTLSAQLIEEEDSSTLYEKLVDAANSIMHSEFASLQIYRAEREPDGALRLLASRGFSPE
ncbi:MAG TPA: GAF domain-containing protein, partial [Longimicrobiales bacterium]|nr:GAF domain-containing protein [Longimicrobiales bacterium]